MTSTVTWGRNAAYANATRLADSYQNRAYLQQQAAQDGTPSAVVKMGNDVALLSGDALRTASRLSTSYNGVISRGGSVNVDGANASVLYTDDGFSEIDARNVVVAVIDTGVDVDAPALAGRIVAPYNVLTGSTDVTDEAGHGTHVAGIIAASTSSFEASFPTVVLSRTLPFTCSTSSISFSISACGSNAGHGSSASVPAKPSRSHSSSVMCGAKGFSNCSSTLIAFSMPLDFLRASHTSPKTPRPRRRTKS